MLNAVADPPFGQEHDQVLIGNKRALVFLLFAAGGAALTLLAPRLYVWHGSASQARISAGVDRSMASAREMRRLAAAQVPGPTDTPGYGAGAAMIGSTGPQIGHAALDSSASGWRFRDDIDPAADERVWKAIVRAFRAKRFYDAHYVIGFERRKGPRKFLFIGIVGGKYRLLGQGEVDASSWVVRHAWGAPDVDSSVTSLADFHDFQAEHAPGFPYAPMAATEILRQGFVANKWLKYGCGDGLFIWVLWDEKEGGSAVWAPIEFYIPLDTTPLKPGAIDPPYVPGGGKINRETLELEIDTRLRM